MLVKFRPKKPNGRPPKETVDNVNGFEKKTGNSRLYIEERLQRELFNVDAEKAIATAKMLATVRAKLTINHGRARNRTGCSKKNNQHAVVFDGPSPDEMMQAGEAYQAYGKSGSTSRLRYKKLYRSLKILQL